MRWDFLVATMFMLPLASSLYGEEGLRVHQGDFMLNTSADLEALSDVQAIEGNLVVGGRDLESIELPNLKSVKSLLITSNGKLKKVSLESLESAELVKITAAFALKELHLPSLQKSQISIVATPLTSLTLTALKKSKKIHLSASQGLDVLDVPALIFVEDLLISNTSLATIKMPKLESVGFLTIADNKELQTIEAETLIRVGIFSAKDNEKLSAESLAFLKGHSTVVQQ